MFLIGKPSLSAPAFNIIKQGIRRREYLEAKIKQVAKASYEHLHEIEMRSIVSKEVYIYIVELNTIGASFVIRRRSRLGSLSFDQWDVSRRSRSCAS